MVGRYFLDNEPVSGIASELGVEALLQGSVRVSDGKLRAQAQLIRAGDGRQLWAETYDRPLEDAFEVQEAIALAVARARQQNVAGWVARKRAGTAADLAARAAEAAQAASADPTDLDRATDGTSQP